MENQKPQSAVSQIKNTNQEPEATTQQKTNMEEAPKHSDGQVTTDKNAEPDMDHTIQTKFLENTKQSQPQDDANTNTAPDDPERDGTEFNPEMLFGPAGGDPLNTGPKKKKKRSSKPKSKRGINKPTGFEEYYVDAPITPEQHTEELGIYDVSRPIIHRMDDALLRYQNNRRLTNERREVFQKYLAYGGVSVDQKMFAGVDNQELQNMDKEQILQIRGQTSIEDDVSNLPIDFDAVARGYLTSFFPYYFNPETEEMVRLATVTIRNFLSYLLYHNVCPEHRENIDAARTSCDIAHKDIWNNQQFTSQGPGDVNKAFSTLFGGVFFDTHVEDNQWESPKGQSVRMTYPIARKVVKFALAGSGSDSQATRFKELANSNALRAMRAEGIDGFKVTSVTFPDPGVKEFYKARAPDLRPVGKMTGKAYRDPGKPGFDLTDQEREEWDRGVSGIEFEFFLEEELLRFCYPGMKVMTAVFELNCGVHFFDEVFAAYSSIYTVLANDLMIGWKRPKNYVRNANEGGGDPEGEKGEQV